MNTTPRGQERELAKAQSQHLAQSLVAQAARRFEEAAEDMQNYAMKHEGRCRHLQHGDEQDAHLRTIIHIVGERNLYLQWEAEVDG